MAVQGVVSDGKTYDYATDGDAIRSVTNGELAAATEEMIVAVEDALVGDMTFRTEDVAASYLHEKLDPIAVRYKIEIGARIYKIEKDGPWYIAQPRSQGFFNRVYSGPVPEGSYGNSAGNWHAHPSGNPPSVDDFDNVRIPERRYKRSYVSYTRNDRRILVGAGYSSKRWEEVKR